ncbi:uncharacterized protein BO87DRAFT_136449 [Aspergillus neoniger CBS 115656]|uniref:Uncharacterized protein n=1 Tax=Aspergillus neoniger (strain CBS 115656) TaxID=1448310 RepID=A0A318YFJ4_ASPNB|nr:hypothetical protein BO87DRAFT_136449 [Aspergillus neoniger CBS 115656]PYH31233.1 hypothetical protein BO87DRAFT_136449 [Aspergillus neoniger CBS 115656]
MLLVCMNPHRVIDTSSICVIIVLVTRMGASLVSSLIARNFSQGMGPRFHHLFFSVFSFLLGAIVWRLDPAMALLF